jgi:hypothetical protein
LLSAGAVLTAIVCLLKAEVINREGGHYQLCWNRKNQCYHGRQSRQKAILTRRCTTEWTEVVSGVTVGDAVVLEPGNLQSGQAGTVVE